MSWGTRVIQRILVALAILTNNVAFAEEEMLEMFLGEVKVMKLGEVERVAVGNGDILSTSALDNGQLIVLAEKEGMSSMHIWLNSGVELNYLVLVTQEPPGRQDLAEIQDMLSTVEGVTARKVGRQIVLEGKIAAHQEALLAKIIERYEAVLDLVVRQAAVLNPEDNKMVLMDVKITEFNTNRLDELGVSWSNPIAGPGAGIAYDAVGNQVFRGGAPLDSNMAFGGLPFRVQSPAGYFGIASEITSRINFLVNSGDAVLLAQPRLVARSGGAAEFLSGGEVPVITSNINGTNVEYKEFGISLSVSPIIDRNNRILASVETEVSSIDNSVAVQGIPGFASRKTTADVNLTENDTLVLSGLVNQEASKDIDRLAGLSEIPILGALFRSKTFRDRQSELVIFVTPTLIDGEAERNKEEIARHQEMREKFSNALTKEKVELIE